MESEHKSPNIEQLIKFFSLAYILLILLGLVYNIFYYKYFGIVITEYIDFGEVLILFTPILTEKSSLIVLVTIILFFGLHRKMSSGKMKDTEAKAIRMSRILIGIIIIAVILLGVFFLFKKDKANNLTYATFTFIVAGLITMLGFWDIVVKWFEHLSFLVVPSLIKEILYVVVIFSTIILTSLMDIPKKVKDHKSKFEIVFKPTNAAINSDSNMYYIGRAKNYIFIYNMQLKKSTVYNVDDVKEFSIWK